MSVAHLTTINLFIFYFHLTNESYRIGIIMFIIYHGFLPQVINVLYNTNRFPLTILGVATNDQNEKISSANT